MHEHLKKSKVRLILIKSFLPLNLFTILFNYSKLMHNFFLNLSHMYQTWNQGFIIINIMVFNNTQMNLNLKNSICDQYPKCKYKSNPRIYQCPNTLECFLILREFTIQTKINKIKMNNIMKIPSNSTLLLVDGISSKETWSLFTHAIL